MKKLVALALVAAMMGACGSAQAAKVWDDMSWWGNTGATPEPVKDATRSGYWWWPTEAASNAGDSELWGNRGIVYNMWQKPEPPAEVVTPPPPEPPKPPMHTITLNAVLFDFDKAVLKPEGKAEVDKLVADMKKWPKDTAEIAGYTCDIGSEQYNLGLGERRADAVKKYMVESGIDAARISAKSYGEANPAVPNDSAEHRKLNRRVEFKVTTAE